MWRRWHSFYHRNRDIYIQIKENPLVKLCFYNTPENKQIRVTGKVEFSDDIQLKDKIVEKFQFLKPVVEEFGYKVISPFYVKNGKAVVWTAESNLEPKTFIDL